MIWPCFTDSGDLVTKNDLPLIQKYHLTQVQTLNDNNITANKIHLNTVNGDNTSGVVHGNLNSTIIKADQSNNAKIGPSTSLSVNGTTNLTGELSE